MKYLGIDYGTKKVGLALSDDGGSMGFPHSVMPNDTRLFDVIVHLIAKEKVEAVVMGESRDFSGAENPVAQEARAFATRLVEAGTPVHFEPEMLTTQEARRDFEGVRTNGHSIVDSSAAALILTSFLSRTPAPTLVEEVPTSKPQISIDDFLKIEVKMGVVRTAERVEDTDKLLRLTVDFNEPAGPRQIVSGIAMYVETPESLVGRQLAFVTNLKPRTIKGLESNGMLFAVGEGDTFAFVTPDREVPPGTAAH
ncbi:MAG: tRNA-binding protein [Parcubacteria bacterium C7867-008]|nr:MAG: tRNA-binding protein [Parcubacteria bacterium C7867-008]